MNLEKPGFEPGTPSALGQGKMRVEVQVLHGVQLQLLLGQVCRLVVTGEAQTAGEHISGSALFSL